MLSIVRSACEIVAQPLLCATVKTSCQCSCRNGCKWLGGEYHRLLE